MSQRVHMAAVYFAALACGSCSLVVGDLPLQCDKPSDCDALNEAEGLDLAKDCFVYQCRSDKRGCEKRPQDLDNDKVLAKACEKESEREIDCDDSWENGEARTPGRLETCDGVDNDCNELIDDGAFYEVTADRLAAPFTGERPIAHLSHASGADGAQYVALTNQEGSTFVDSLLSTSVWRYETSDPSTFVGGETTINRGGTAIYDCVGERPVRCSLVELVLGAAPDLLVALGVNRAGCGAGQMRAGSLGLGSGFMPERGGLGWTEPLSTCASGAPASRASLGVLASPTGGRQALALWRTASIEDAHGSAKIAGTGLWLDRSDEAPPIIRSTDGTELSQLPESDGHDPAAVVAWNGVEQAGFFVAYDTAGAVQLAFVPRLRDATTPAMGNWLHGTPVQEVAPRHVALALDHDTDTTLDRPVGLAAAWRTEGGEIRFARLSFDPDVTAALSAVTTETLLSGATITEGPEIVYLRRGLWEPVSAPDGPAGGWFVTWLERDGTITRLVGMRIPEAATVERPKPFLIYQGHQLRHLFAYREGDDSTPGYGFVDIEARPQQLYIGSLNCGPKN